MTLWGLVSYILYKNSKKKLNYDIYIKSKVSKNKVIIVAGIIFVYLLTKYFIVGGIKPIQEFNNLGVIKFIFQYAYYFFETLLILLTIAFGQKFMDNIFKIKIFHMVE